MLNDPDHLTDDELAHRTAAAMAVVMNQHAADAFALGRCPGCRDPQTCRETGCVRGAGLGAANVGPRAVRSAA